MRVLDTFQNLWFFCCHFELVFLQKDLMIFNGNASEDLIFSRLTFNKFKSFNTVVS